MTDEKKIEENNSSKDKVSINTSVLKGNKRTVNTGGGAYIEGNVKIVGGDFIGRDKIINIHNYPPVLKAPLREVFDPLIENRTELFGGRETALNRLGDFIKDPTGGYMVVTAPAGFGKTALMANMINLKPDAFAYHFFTPLYGDSSLTENFFLANVVEQMSQWHRRQEELPESLNTLRALYHYFIDEPLEQTRILVIDGLDEVATWKLAPYLSRRLPENLHIILTVRDVGQDWLGEYELPEDQTRHLPLGGLNYKGVAEVLHAAGGGAVAFANDPTLLGQVMRASAYGVDERLGADPFYVYLLAKDAAEGRLTPENISNQPQGLEHYLDSWWQALKNQAGDQATRNLFGTLTVALGPISRTDLEVINPSLVDDWTEDYFDEVLERVQRWVVCDPYNGYALVHPRLHQYLQSRIKTTPYLEKLLAFCANWKSNHSSYARRYYVIHLIRARQFEQLVQFIQSDALMELYPVDWKGNIDERIIEIVGELSNQPGTETYQMALFDIFADHHDFYLAAEALSQGCAYRPETIARLEDGLVQTPHIGGQLQPFWNLMGELAIRGRPKVRRLMETLLIEGGMRAENVLYVLIGREPWPEILTKIIQLYETSRSIAVVDLCRKVLLQAQRRGLRQLSAESLLDDEAFYLKVGIDMLTRANKLDLEPELRQLVAFQVTIQKLAVGTYPKSVHTFERAAEDLIRTGSWLEAVSDNHLISVSSESNEYRLLQLAIEKVSD